MEMRQLRAIEERVRNPVSTPDGGIYKVTQSPYHTTRSKQVQTLRKLMVVNSARISCPVLNCVCCKHCQTRMSTSTEFFFSYSNRLAKPSF